MYTSINAQMKIDIGVDRYIEISISECRYRLKENVEGAKILYHGIQKTQ